MNRCRACSCSIPTTAIIGTRATTGMVLALVGVAQTIVAAGLVRQAVKKFGELPTALVGLACGVAGFIAYALAPTGSHLSCRAAAGGSVGPGRTGLSGAWRRGSPARTSRATLQGALASLRGMSGMIGPITFTQISPGRSPAAAAPAAAMALPRCCWR